MRTKAGIRVVLVKKRKTLFWKKKTNFALCGRCASTEVRKEESLAFSVIFGSYIDISYKFSSRPVFLFFVTKTQWKEIFAFLTKIFPPQFILTKENSNLLDLLCNCVNIYSRVYFLPSTYYYISSSVLSQKYYIMMHTVKEWKGIFYSNCV